MKTHPKVGYDFIKANDPLMSWGVTDIILHHHERFDGNGYPDGLIADEISLATRIVTVADCFDAMTSNRLYRNAKDKSTAVRELLNNAYKQFDPQITQVFAEFILTGATLLSPPCQLQCIISYC